MTDMILDENRRIAIISAAYAAQVELHRREEERAMARAEQFVREQVTPLFEDGATLRPKVN